MYKVYKFTSIREYEIFIEGICSLEKLQIVSVNAANGFIIVTTHKEDISAY